MLRHLCAHTCISHRGGGYKSNRKSPLPGTFFEYPSLNSLVLWIYRMCQKETQKGSLDVLQLYFSYNISWTFGHLSTYLLPINGCIMFHSIVRIILVRLMDFFFHSSKEVACRNYNSNFGFHDHFFVLSELSWLSFPP